MRVWGLFGYALASMIVPVVINLVVVPRYACNLVGLSYASYLAKGWLKACAYSVPLAISAIVFANVWQLTSWKILAVTSLSCWFFAITAGRLMAYLYEILVY